MQLLASKGGKIDEDAPAVSLRPTKRRSWREGVASGVALLTAAGVVVLAMGWQAGASEAWVTFGGVGVLFAAALLHILLAPRWRSEGGCCSSPRR